MTKTSIARRPRSPATLAGRGRELAGRGREIWLAGLGAAAAVEDDGAEALAALVRRGEKVERAARRRIAAAGSRLVERERNLAARLDEGAQHVVERALGRLGVPTREEVRALSRRMDSLARKVALLAERLAPPAPDEPKRE